MRDKAYGVAPKIVRTFRLVRRGTLENCYHARSSEATTPKCVLLSKTVTPKSVKSCSGRKKHDREAGDNRVILPCRPLGPKPSAHWVNGESKRSVRSYRPSNRTIYRRQTDHRVLGRCSPDPSGRGGTLISAALYSLFVLIHPGKTPRAHHL